jgi:hydroxyacylglutathione hydrolase
MRITDDVHGFFWSDYRANNANTYLVKGKHNILIDPGHYHLFDHVATELQRLSLEPADIDLVLITHGHPDHTEGIRVFSRLPALIAMHEVEVNFLRDLAPRLDRMREGFDFQPDFQLQEGELKVGDMIFQVLHTPGHSRGSLCLYLPDEKALFTGDVIFSQGLGRTDLPGGNADALKASIRRLAQLDVEYLLPGHGEWLSGREAVKANFDAVESMWFGYL